MPTTTIATQRVDSLFEIGGDTSGPIGGASMGRFILVLHHERRKELRAYYRLLAHNLRANCPPELRVVDVDECMDERNLYAAIQVR